MLTSEMLLLMLLWGIFGHWQNIRRIRKAKRRLAAGRAWWGHPEIWPVHGLELTLDKNANCLAAASMKTFFSSSTHFTGTFYCRGA